MGGTYSADSAATSMMAFDDRELEIDADGTFEFTYVAEPGAKTMIVREVFNDWDTEERGTLTIERPDTGRPAGQAADRGDAAPRSTRSPRSSLTGSIQTWFAFPQFFQYKEPVNTLTVPQSTPGGLASQRSSIGHYELDDDEALIVTRARVHRLRLPGRSRSARTGTPRPTTRPTRPRSPRPRPSPTPTG